ncbi:MAG TPA: LptA/OstA family protein [Methylovirgula sp.]
MRQIRPAFWAVCLTWIVTCGPFVATSPARAQSPQPATTSQSKSVHIKSTAARNGNKQPIAIQAAKLDYYDKEQKLIYRGHVVAVRGDTTLKTPLLTVFLNPKNAGTQPGPPSTDSQVKRMEAMGPVTIIAKDQIATGDFGTYEKNENKIYLKGNVTLSQGPNVTKGDYLIYDTTTGQAVVTGNVRSMFVPNNANAENPGEGSKASDSTANTDSQPH